MSQVPWCTVSDRRVETLRARKGFRARLQVAGHNPNGDKDRIEALKDVPPKKVTCPECSRRLKPKTVDTEPGWLFDPVYVVPRHKVGRVRYLRSRKPRRQHAR